MERGQRHFPDGARQEQALWEVTRLNEVEGFIQRKASRLAEDDPMLAEDLAQEGREAVIRRLREAPDCPTSHLVVKARDAIYRFRRRGSSVDGKRYPAGRPKHYQIVDLEASTEEDGSLLAEVLADPQTPRRSTERQACTNIFLADLRDRLSSEENQVLTLRLMAVPWSEVQKMLGRSARETGQVREQIATTARVVWGLPVTEDKSN